MPAAPRTPVALVTGARRGLGRAIAFALAEAGYDLVINDLVEDEGAEATLAGIRDRGRRTAFVRADIADTAAHAGLVEAAFAAFGTLDCLVNNAGVQVAVRGDILEATPEDYDRVMGVNLRGTFFLSTAVARRMLAEDRSTDPTRRSIVSICSTSINLVQPQLAAYCLSKSGVNTMTKMLAHRLAAHDIYVLEVRPGVTRSDMSGQIKDKYDRLFAESDAIPMKRWGEPEGIGRAVAALATGAIPFCTGDGVNIDGGLHLHAFIP
ncbi:3-ketoacyl-ACP reductase [Ruixingdingia sedimenti]|uniref:3-ketoacyl-ACP reductase n=1 Tax=Ruixingdingia sedimenti TaxID=3073604 RepID=A0ABU1F325_9RHOB|nr:3-ketoacyl-ACP reductase [Xinfangfangia sp. LG-4]MDR5651252.1 3-ketoacyl-ACP reductase [Xinfangfangia sp. LG-4]